MRQYRLIAFDMDGTLLNSDKKISKETIEAIQKAVRQDKYVVLSTGRCLPELEEYFDDIPALRYIIGVSGACVYDIVENQMIYENMIEINHVKTLLEISKKYDCMVHLLSNKSVVKKDDIEHMEHFHMENYQEMYQRVTSPVEDLHAYFKENPLKQAKMNFYHESIASRDAMNEEVKSLPLERVFAEKTSLECSAMHVSKATGLQKLCEHLHIPLEETIAVGDGDNDLEILKAAGLAIAMENANENVKQIADVIVCDNDHNGCVEAIEKYLL